MIRVRQGSIFDTKCDLLIIPCDSGGGVTSSVFKNLEGRALPTRVGTIPLGKVHFRDVRYENASTLAYCASVETQTVRSNSQVVSSIAREVREYCKRNGILSVNLPLLGSGAGGMSAIDSFDALRREVESDERTVYSLFCFTRAVYNEIVAAYQPEESAVPHPRVFISYAGNDKDNAAWVKEFAGALRANGIDARLDVFHLKPGFDLPQWMTNEVVLADKVILICDSHYTQKADFRKGGVGWETMIIQGDMLAQGDNKQKYIVIVREEEVEKALPIYVRSKFALAWGKKQQSETQMRELILRLFDCDTEPELGAIPEYVREKLQPKGADRRNPRDRGHAGRTREPRRGS